MDLTDQNEVVSEEFTGIIPQDNDNSCRQDLVAVLNQNEAFEQLRNTKGWKLLEKFIHDQVDSMTQLLKVETDFDKIRRLQAEILAFESLEKIMETSFVNAEEAKKLLMQELRAA